VLSIQKSRFNAVNQEKNAPLLCSDLVFFVMAASDFYETLNRLGLSQYHDSLVQEAFDSWDVLADITEEDL
jgi:hypothetical protein